MTKRSKLSIRLLEKGRGRWQRCGRIKRWMLDDPRNGYDSSKAGTSPVLIGGGVGIPPLYGLLKALQRQRAADAKAARAAGASAYGESAGTEKIRVILGFNTAEEIFYQNEFEAAGAEVLLATADGSAGVKGFVTDVLAGLDYSYFYTCGPEADVPRDRARREDLRTVQLRGAHGLRLRRLHGLLLRDQIRQQADLQRWSGAGKGGNPMVNLKVKLCGIALDNPVIPAGGTFGYGSEYASFCGYQLFGEFFV